MGVAALTRRLPRAQRWAWARCTASSTAPSSSSRSARRRARKSGAARQRQPAGPALLQQQVQLCIAPTCMGAQVAHAVPCTHRLDVEVWDSTTDCLGGLRRAGYQIVTTHLSESSVTIQARAAVGTRACPRSRCRRVAAPHRPGCSRRACALRGRQRAAEVKTRACPPPASAPAGGRLDAPHCVCDGQRARRCERRGGGDGRRGRRHPHGRLCREPQRQRGGGAHHGAGPRGEGLRAYAVHWRRQRMLPLPWQEQGKQLAHPPRLRPRSGRRRSSASGGAPTATCRRASRRC